MVTTHTGLRQVTETCGPEQTIPREPITVLPFGGDGKPGRVLIIYHPGNDNLEILLRGALADGLRLRGWHIDMTTLIPSNWTQATEFDLVVLAAPVQEGHAARLLLDYVDHAEGLAGKSMFLVLVGGALTAEAMTELRNHVARAGGRIAEAIELDVDEADQTALRMHDLEEVVHRAAEDLVFVRRPIAARTY